MAKKVFKEMTKQQKQEHIKAKVGVENYDAYVRGLEVGRSIKGSGESISYMNGLRRALRPKSKKQRIAYWEMVKKNAKSDKQKKLADSKLSKLKK